MGLVADFASVSAELWPAVLPAIRAAGIDIQDNGMERGGWWYTCVQGPARVELAYFPDDKGREVCVYCSAHRFWRRPWAMWRLLREVWKAILATGAARTPHSGPIRKE
jgi:hypothetical protein